MLLHEGMETLKKLWYCSLCIFHMMLEMIWETKMKNHPFVIVFLYIYIYVYIYIYIDISIISFYHLKLTWEHLRIILKPPFLVLTLLVIKQTILLN